MALQTLLFGGGLDAPLSISRRQSNKHGRYHHEDDPNPARLWMKTSRAGARSKQMTRGIIISKRLFPAPYPAEEGWQRPPHIHFKPSKREYHELTTQMYFAGHELNEKDRILLELPEAERGKVIVEFREGRQTMILERNAANLTLYFILRRVRKS